MLDRLRLAVASCTNFQTLCGVATTALARPFVDYEDPFQAIEDNGGFTLPHAYILWAEQKKAYISGGANPNLFPQASEYAVLIKFWPDATYHDAGDSSNDFLKANDIAGEIYDELCGDGINGKDIEYDGETVPLPSFTASSHKVFDSNRLGIQDVYDKVGERFYRYYWEAVIELEVRP